MPTIVRNDGVVFNDGSLQTSASGIISIIKVDINAAGNRTATTVRLGATVDYLDIAVSGISDFTKCVIHPLELSSQSLVSFYIRLYGQFIGTKMGGSIELVNNSTLRVYFTGTLATTDRQVRGRLQIIQFK
jgi:hypothetical protein